MQLHLTDCCTGGGMSLLKKCKFFFFAMDNEATLVVNRIEIDASDLDGCSNSHP